MKKIALPLVLLSLLAVAPAYADDSKIVAPDEAIPLAGENEKLCREAISLQERRITDLKAAVEYDKKVERELHEGARVREADATAKEEHAKRFREAADKASDANKKRTFSAFATWLESEARTDRDFARERREAAKTIGKGWAQALEAIRGHEKYLGELRTSCAS
jgi:hypothetical protein